MFAVANKEWCLGLSELSFCVCAFYRRISKLRRGAIDSALPLLGNPG